MFEGDCVCCGVNPATNTISWEITGGFCDACFAEIDPDVVPYDQLDELDRQT